MIMNDTTKIVMTLITAVTVLTSVGVTAVGYSSYARGQLMAKDVQSALDKGFNPIVVRCAYADEGDRICLVYAASRGDEKKVDVMVTKPSK